MNEFLLFNLEQWLLKLELYFFLASAVINLATLSLVLSCISWPLNLNCLVVIFLGLRIVTL